MLLLSWNVNGIRSVVKKGLLPLINSSKYDVLMFQEVKSDILPLGLHMDGYFPFMFPSKAKKGYSGTMTLSKIAPKSVIYGIGDERFDKEGRVLTLELHDFYLINAYFPNSRRDLSRLQFKLEFNDKILRFAEELRKKKPIIMCGDFNVAHEDIDLARPKENAENAGFTKVERDWFTMLLKTGYIDTYRIFIKEGGHYTWWTYRADARSRNIGWRIDYFVVSKELTSKIKGADIMKDVYGSDHVPIYIKI